jgi:hypothetical protein
MTDAAHQIALTGSLSLPFGKNLTPVVTGRDAVAEFNHPISSPIFSNSSTSAWNRYIEADDNTRIE